MSVRFVDPKTNEIVYPEPFETPSSAITPGLGTNAPPVGSFALNPLLVPTVLSWDVRHPFEADVERWPQLERARIGQSATQPPSSRLEIRSPHLPWEIKVRPGTSDLFVTVFDVLYTIQATLKHHITPREWERFDYVGKRAIVAARGLRIQEYDPGRQVDETYHHPRRIDSLGEFTQFAGLVSVLQRGTNALDLKFTRRG